MRSNAKTAYIPPKYGQAAAIHALYQSALLAPEERRKKPPSKPRGGKLRELMASVMSALRVPAFAHP